jgi:hypothetical protein
MANALRLDFDAGPLAEIVSALKTDFVVLGLGLQEKLPPQLDCLPQNTQHLVREFGARARLLGVRGADTERWLHAVGVNNAVALGCPSLFVYPQNIVSLRPPELHNGVTCLTSGYIHKPGKRANISFRLFEGNRAHYVMQTELYAMRAELEVYADVYNDATGLVNKSHLDPLFLRMHDCTPPFLSYRWFMDPSAWRCFASTADFYLGERFHGGVAAIQAGVPAAFIVADTRMSELVNFFQLPRIDYDDCEKTDLMTIVDDRLNADSIAMFVDSYRTRFAKLRQTLSEAGLNLAVGFADESFVGTQEHSRLPILHGGFEAVRRRIRGAIGPRF